MLEDGVRMMPFFCMAFVKESTRVIGFASNQHLTLSDNLPINEVTKQAFNHLGNNGLISVANVEIYKLLTCPSVEIVGLYMVS